MAFRSRQPEERRAEGKRWNEEGKEGQKGRKEEEVGGREERGGTCRWGPIFQRVVRT